MCATSNCHFGGFRGKGPSADDQPERLSSTPLDGYLRSTVARTFLAHTNPVVPLPSHRDSREHYSWSAHRTDEGLVRLHPKQYRTCTNKERLEHPVRGQAHEEILTLNYILSTAIHEPSLLRF